METHLAQVGAEQHLHVGRAALPVVAHHRRRRSASAGAGSAATSGSVGAAWLRKIIGEGGGATRPSRAPHRRWRWGSQVVLRSARGCDQTARRADRPGAGPAARGAAVRRPRRSRARRRLAHTARAACSGSVIAGVHSHPRHRAHVGAQSAAGRDEQRRELVKPPPDVGPHRSDRHRRSLLRMLAARARAAARAASGSKLLRPAARGGVTRTGLARGWVHPARHEPHAPALAARAPCRSGRRYVSRSRASGRPRHSDVLRRAGPAMTGAPTKDGLTANRSEHHRDDVADGSGAEIDHHRQTTTGLRRCRLSVRRRHSQHPVVPARLAGPTSGYIEASRLRSRAPRASQTAAATEYGIPRGTLRLPGRWCSRYP